MKGNIYNIDISNAIKLIPLLKFADNLAILSKNIVLRRTSIFLKKDTIVCQHFYQYNQIPRKYRKIIYFLQIQIQIFLFQHIFIIKRNVYKVLFEKKMHFFVKKNRNINRILHKTTLNHS